MSNVVPIHRDAHREALSLLPWYVNGALTEDERVAIDAHLEACADCRAELEFERRIAAEIAALPIDAEPAWAAMEQRLEAPAKRRAKPMGRRTMRTAKAALPWIGWALAAQILLLLGMRATLPAPKAAAPPTYRALASASASTGANVALIFRPRTTEVEIQAILRANNGRVVDGPTAADAWLVAVPPATRSKAIQNLRLRPAVVTAEPLDPTGP
jgi:predicted anti-sigma-YlaC factor YlaD